MDVHDREMADEEEGDQCQEDTQVPVEPTSKRARLCHEKSPDKMPSVALCAADAPGEYLVALGVGDEIAFTGDAGLSILHGSVDVAGYIIAAPSTAVLPLLTFNMSAAITISSIRPSGTQSRETSGPSSSRMQHLLDHFHARYPTVGDEVAVIRLTSTDTSLVGTAVTLHPSFRHALHQADWPLPLTRQASRVVFDLPCSLTPTCHVHTTDLLVVPPSWHALLETVAHGREQARASVGPLPATTLICGGRDTGKSTLARWLVNRLLSTHAPQVCACVYEEVLWMRDGSHSAR